MMPVPILDIPVSIPDFEAFKQHFNREWDQEVFRTDGTSYMARLSHDVENLRHDHWRIVTNSAAEGYVLIESLEHKSLFHCPELLLLRDNP